MISSVSSAFRFLRQTKNSINEQLFATGTAEADLNPYSKIITKEAQMRGISVIILDAEHDYFKLSLWWKVGCVPGVLDGANIGHRNEPL
jgi:hypothetical protein